jgi:hypothetical protein
MIDLTGIVFMICIFMLCAAVVICVSIYYGAKFDILGRKFEVYPQAKSSTSFEDDLELNTDLHEPKNTGRKKEAGKKA